MENRKSLTDETANRIKPVVISRFLLPNDFLTKHERKTAKGRIFWLANDKKVFCKLYLDADYKSFDKHELHFFMYANRGGTKFNNSGFPDWQYTEKPVKLKWQNGL
jgi:hypothetical protein